MLNHTYSNGSVTDRQITREMRDIDGFGEVRVYLTEDNTWYPSVTTVNNKIRLDPDKERSLNYWKRNNDGTGGTEHHSDILKVKTHFGTLAHYYAFSSLTKEDLWGESETTAKQELQNHGDYEGIDAWEWACNRFEYVQKHFYQAFENEEITNILGVEQYILDTDVGYGGQYDLLYTRDGPNGEETVLCDLKTGSGIRTNDELQAAAYAHAVDVDVDQLKIVRAHATSSDREFEIRTDEEFSSSREELFDEFSSYVNSFHKRVDRAKNRTNHENNPSSTTATETSSSTSEDNSNKIEDTMKSLSPENDTKSDTDTNNTQQDPIEEAVETYTGAPFGLSEKLRKKVDDQKIPDVIDTELGGVQKKNRIAYSNAWTTYYLHLMI